jgi:putative ABC transport system permease protein
MGIRLTEGVTFTDTSAASAQVIVNASFARKQWPAGGALGHRLRISRTGTEPWLTVIGVASDARPSGPAAESTAPMLYLPPSSASEAIIVRSAGDARSLAPLAKIARNMGARALTIESVENLMAGFMAEPRFVMLLLTAFSAFGLALATIGLYGVMTFTVAQETRDIGIRVALGASRSSLVRRVIGRGVGLAAAGAGIGLAASTWVTKIIAGRLYGVDRLDPAAFACGGILLVAAAVIACIVPTRRAVSVDPMTAIRNE